MAAIGIILLRRVTDTPQHCAGDQPGSISGFYLTNNGRHRANRRMLFRQSQPSAIFNHEML